MASVDSIRACVLPAIFGGLCLAAPWAYAQDSTDQSSETGQPAEERIVTREEVEAATTSAGTSTLKVIGWPIHQLLRGMNSGLVSFERHNIQQKISEFQARLNARGIWLMYGGLGQGSGFGLGITQEIPPRPDARARDYLGDERVVGLKLTARISPLTNYQELSASFETSPFLRSSLIVHTDYQWRPDEQFYGLGQDSREEDRSSFGLRQWSAGALWQLEPSRHFRFGSEYRGALLKALALEGGLSPSVARVFGPDLPGLDQRVDLQSVGAFLETDFLRGDYGLGAFGHVSASWQDSFGGPDIRYARYEARLEGRLPVVRDSALVGHLAAELTRKAAGSEPIPFYLNPRIGGSTTLRGFALDRFYGRNMIFLSLEYRYAIHPNFEFQILHDAGQIFDHTAELGALTWHRMNGIGLRYKTETGTAFRIEIARSVEGVAVQISFGDRVSRPLGGPVRYPVYRP